MAYLLLIVGIMLRPILALVCFSSLVAGVSAAPIIPTSYNYNVSPWGYWDDTGTQLTDGLYNNVIPGANLATPDAYNWVGWDGNSPSITFNFNQVVTINTLALSSVKWTNAAVYLPTQVTIGSDVFSVNDGDYTNLDKALLSFNGSWTGTALTVQLERGGQWTFLDEVSFDGVIGAGTNNPPSNNVPDESSVMVMLGLGLIAAVVGRARFPGFSGRTF